MAGKKKPYMRIETQEEFDKLFKSIYNEGYDEGFKDGNTVGLSYVLETIEKFTEIGSECDIRRNAEYMLGERKKEEWKRRMQLIDNAKKQAVEEYKKTGGNP